MPLNTDQPAEMPLNTDQPAEVLLKTDQAAEELTRLGWPVAPKTMLDWRVDKKGPAYRTIGHRVRYLPEALREFVDARTRDVIPDENVA